MDHIAKLLPAAALAVLLSGLSGAQAAKVCKPSFYSSGEPGPNSATGKLSARTEWSVRAGLKYTPKFANWNNAASKSQGCKVKTSVVGANLYYCWARAKPCAYE